MLKFVRIAAGADPQFEQHLFALLDLYTRLFPFNSVYAEKITRYAQGDYPEGSEVILLGALQRNRIVGFSVTFFFSDLAAGYLDYIGSEPRKSGRGIGAALYETAREDVRNRGADRFFLESLPDDRGPLVDESLLPDNRKRMAFYERLGARPVLGTAYESTVTPANLGDPAMLLCDAMGDAQPLSLERLRGVIVRIMLAKNGLPEDDPLTMTLVNSATEDPVRLRPPKYVSVRRAKLRPDAQPLDVVFTASEAPSIDHSPFKGYFERPARAASIRKALDGVPMTVHPAESFGLDPILDVHDADMVAFLSETPERIPAGQILYPEVFPLRHPDRRPRNWEMRAGYFCYDTSTPLTNMVYPAARNAADAAMTGARLLANGKSRRCYVVVRPPGHHAEHRMFGGFCYLNNAAIAAHELSRKGKVALLDIDYHHGNGAQDIFWKRNDVLTVSIHGHPENSYPFFSGFDDEVGEGPGEGYNVNFPLRAGIDDAAYLNVLETAFARIHLFAPDFLVVCFGADIMRGDPTGEFFVTSAGLHRIGERLSASALPMLVVQEGGYSLSNLRSGVREFAVGLLASG